MICLKIRTFVVSATTLPCLYFAYGRLWFAWKFVPLWYQQQPIRQDLWYDSVVICLKIRTFVVSATTIMMELRHLQRLWFAWKFVPLWYQQQLIFVYCFEISSCDLLENSYLCGISNNSFLVIYSVVGVVICLKIRTFVVSATTIGLFLSKEHQLWFAWKFVPLWYQQQLFR